MTPWDENLFYNFFDLLLKILTLLGKLPPRIGFGPVSHWDGNPQIGHTNRAHATSSKRGRSERFTT